MSATRQSVLGLVCLPKRFHSHDLRKKKIQFDLNKSRVKTKWESFLLGVGIERVFFFFLVPISKKSLDLGNFGSTRLFAVSLKTKRELEIVLVKKMMELY